MGSDCHVVVRGARRLVDRAVAWTDELEQRWSRFLPDSEISRLNSARGAAHEVSSATRELVETAIGAWELTGGAFDPTVHDSLVALGYSTDYSQIRDTGFDAPRHPAPGCAGIEVDDLRGTVLLPAGVGFDPGGIGKGLAADMVACRLLDEGAAGALVNIGGDIRLAGDAPENGWVLAVQEPGPEATELFRCSLDAGGLATSSVLRRRWKSAGQQRHHLIDPRTGRPVDSPRIGVTVHAGTAWWAEALTKAVLAGGLPIDGLAGFDAAGVAVADDGEVDATSEFASMIGAPA